MGDTITEQFAESHSPDMQALGVAPIADMFSIALEAIVAQRRAAASGILTTEQLQIAAWQDRHAGPPLSCTHRRHALALLLRGLRRNTGPLQQYF